MSKKEFIDFIVLSKPLKQSYSFNMPLDEYKDKLNQKFLVEDEIGLFNPPEKRFYGQFDSQNSDIFFSRIKTSLSRYAKTMQPLISIKGSINNVNNFKTRVDIEYVRTNESKNQTLYALIFILIILLVLIFKMSGFLSIITMVLFILFALSTGIITWYNIITRQKKYFEDFLIDNE